MSPSSRVTEDEKKEGGGGGGVEEEGERRVLGRVRGVLRKEEIQSQFEELRKRRAHGQGECKEDTYRLREKEREKEREKGGGYNYFIL